MTALGVVLWSAVLAATPASPPPEIGLTSDEIDGVIKAHMRPIRACYEKELAREPGLAAGGKLVVAFTITGRGKVRDVEVKRAFQPAVDACVKRELQTLAFPAKGSSLKVSYPFLFRS